ncbi:DUF4347 domain-containing protein, partial [Dapis sp. BLCC M172]|uniref:DUF4347 domain-containing protein n=1 Tax=Dapis sp. BLCC M172 TaxID=2975281 RepID=UPI003CE9A463
MPSNKKIIESLGRSTETEIVKEIVFLDSHVDNYQDFATEVSSGTKVFIIEPNDDGIQQITKVIKKYSQISSIHIISHGSPGCLYLGNSQLNINNINNNYSAALKTWSVTNIFLYGCNLASGDAGAEFLEKLHKLTGANIAASAQATGSSALGGNWELEVTKGEIEVSLPFSDRIQNQWEHILAEFEDQPYLFQVLNDGTNSQLNVFNPTRLNYITIGEPQVEYNAAGFNRQDNFIYGIRGGSRSGNVIRVHSDGTVEDVLINGEVITVPETGEATVDINAGDVDDDNNLWVKTGDSQLTRIDLETGDRTPFNLTGDGLEQVGDIIYNDDQQKFYGVGPDGNLYTIDPDDPEGPSITTTAVAGLLNRQYGAAWTNDANTLYVSRNREGELYRINDFTTDNPVAERVLDNIQGTGNNDGMSDPERPDPTDVWLIDPDPDPGIIEIPDVNDLFDHETTFTEDTTPVNIVTDKVSISDFLGVRDDDNDIVEGALTQTIITLKSPQDTDELQVDVDALPNNIIRSEDSNSNLIILEDIGFQDPETELSTRTGDFEIALQAVTFNNTDNTPDTTPREVDIQIFDSGNKGGNISTVTIDVIPANDAPSFSEDPDSPSSLDNTPTYTLGGDAVVLDSDATITDPELNERNYDGAILTLARNGEANSEDVFSSGDTNILGALTEGEDLTVDSIVIGTVTTNSDGTLELSFNSNATEDLVDLALQQIAYSNNGTGTDPVTINYTINDGNVEFSDSSVAVEPEPNNAVFIDENASISNNETQVVDYNNVSLVVQRSGGANSEDVFDVVAGGTLDFTGGNLTVDGTTIGTVTTNGNGRLELTFDESATTALVNQALRQITYSNTNANQDDTIEGTATVDPDPNSPVVIDANATIGNQDIDYNGASLILQRNDGANSEDVFSNSDGTLGALTENSRIILEVDGTDLTLGTVTTNSNGQLKLTFNSNATEDLVNEVLQQITYENTSDEQNAVEIDYFITRPVVIDYGIRNGSATVDLSNTTDAQVIDPSATLPDIDYSSASLLVQRSGGANSDDVFDVVAGGTLDFTDGNLTVDGTTIGTVTTNSAGQLQLTFNSSATEDLVNEALQQITYSNNSNNAPDEVIIDYRVFEQGIGGPLEGTGSITVTIEANVPTNSPPTLDLDEDDSTATGNDYITTFTEGTPVAIGDTDVVITDADDTNIESATIILTNRLDGDAVESLSFSGAPVGEITAGVYNQATGTITLTGSGTLAEYQTAIAQIQYNNTSTNPNTTARSVTVVVNDGDDNSNTATTTINITPPNSPPTLDLDGDDSSGATGNDYITTFTEGTPVAIGDTDVVITDADDTNIESATIILTNRLDGDAVESLSFSGAPVGEITAGVYNQATGTITLTGSGTLAEYQTAIAQIQYNNTSTNPNTTARSVTVVVNDGDDNSNTATTTINIIATTVNEPPVAVDDSIVTPPD